MLSPKKKQQLKNHIITELFNSNQLQEKIIGICQRHHITLQADIQSDILQVAFENLAKYDVDKLIEAYQSNPSRILALATRMAIRNGVLLDKRIPKSWYKSIAQQILHQSTFNTLTTISTNENDEDDFSMVLQDEAQNVDEVEQEHAEMWQYIKQRLAPHEVSILDLVLSHNQPKLKGQQKKDYQALLPKLKEIITEYKTKHNDH